MRSGRPPDLAGENIERAADSHDEGNAEIVAIGSEKPLLARRRHADEEAIGSARRGYRGPRLAPAPRVK